MAASPVSSVATVLISSVAFTAGVSFVFSTIVVSSASAVFTSVFLADFLGLVEESIASKSILEITLGASNSGAEIFEISIGSFSVAFLSDFTSADLLSDGLPFFDAVTLSLASLAAFASFS